MKKFIAFFLILMISFTAINAFATSQSPLSDYTDATIGKSFYVYYTAEYDNTLGIEGTVSYNSDYLDFVGVSTDLSGWVAQMGNQGRILVWNDNEVKNPVNNGSVAFKLEFKFKQGVADKYETAIVLEEGLDDKDNVLTGQCTVSVKWLKGDGDNNGTVDQIDRINLSRFLASWKGYTEPYNSDIDGDGNITQKDRIILSRYLASWHGTYDTYFE